MCNTNKTYEPLNQIAPIQSNAERCQTENNNNNPFNGLLSRTTRVSQYQKKHPLTRTLFLWLLYNIFMLHGSETWPVRKENKVALQRAEMRMVRWMCNVRVKDRVPGKELRERLGIDDIILLLQQNRLQWYGHVLRKEDTDWVKKCTEYEVEGSRPRGRPNRTWKEVVQKDCQARNLNKEDAMDRGRWKKLIKTG